MKIFIKSIVIFIIFFCVALFLFIFNAFKVVEMHSNSMEPLIFGNGTPPSHRGNYMIVEKYFNMSSLRDGDLVLVDLKTPDGIGQTVRMIDQQNDTPVGYYYVKALRPTSTDSRTLGPLPASKIRGKVIFVIKDCVDS